MKKQTERDLQIAVMDYIGYFYPKALAIHVPNEGRRNPKYVKRSGVTAGVSDVLVFDARLINNEMYFGLAIELKRKPNKPTERQFKFMAALRDRGWSAYVCFTFDEAKEIIDWYLKK